MDPNKPVRTVFACVAALLLAMLLAAPHAGTAAAADKPGKPGPPAAAKTDAPAESTARNADGEPARFRVDMVMEQGGERHVMRRYVDGPRSRMEMEAEGQKMVTIELGDEKGTTYMLMPAEKRAIKMTKSAMSQATAGMKGMPKQEAEPEPEAADLKGKLESLGTETIDGKVAEKFRVTMPEGTGLMWVESATQLPLRMEAEGMKVEMKDYDFAPQSPALFEPPKGYDVMDMDEMMKKMGGAKGMAGLMAGGGGGMPGMPSVGGMASGMAGDMGGQMGGQLGAGLGASVGGPVGGMIGQYLGQRIGRSIAQRAVKAVGVK